MEVTARTFYQGTATDDYVQITLTDEEDIPDGMQKLRTIYPFVKDLQKYIHNIRMSFFNLIKQNNGIRLSSDLFG